MKTGLEKTHLVEKSKANRFMYETVRGGKVSGTHAYYTMDSAATGRYASQNDTEEYVVSYYDGRPETELITLVSLLMISVKNLDIKNWVIVYGKRDNSPPYL